MVPVKVLVSAGESSGDLYASELVQALQRLRPGTEFFGCAGPRMQKAGVRPVVDSRSLAVVGLVEVLSHIPRIYGQYRKLLRAVDVEKPQVAVLTDSPDFHLRLARKLKKRSIPVVYLVAPQVWAWRRGRIPQMRRNLARLLCIFPFEEEFFRKHGLRADYIGHPLTRLVKPNLSKDEFFRQHGLQAGRPLIAMLPGSRSGEIARHLPPLTEAVRRLTARFEAQALLAAPLGFSSKAGPDFFRERIGAAAIKIIEGETWDVVAHADLALAASGTVTIEAALLGAPMVTFYKVTRLSWWIGRALVRVPYYSMVNLIAERKIVPELMQDEMTAEKLVKASAPLLEDPDARERMKCELAEVAARLRTTENPMARAAAIVSEFLVKDETDVS